MSGREQPARCIDSSGDFGLVGEIQLVFAGEHLVREVAQSIMSDSRVFFRARISTPPAGSRADGSNARARSSDTGSSGRHRRA